MNFHEYQVRATETAIYPGKGTVLGLAYVGLGLGEQGEIQGKIKKIIRDNGGEISSATRLAIAKELGDLLWYIAATAEEIDYGLGDIARMNLAKLASRAERGVLAGSGDDR